MPRNFVRALALVVGLTMLGVLTGDRAGLQASTAGVCLACTGPQCWCDPRDGADCDGAIDKVCKCNTEE